VPADRGQTCTLEERLEVAVDYVLGVEGGALARGEYELVRTSLGLVLSGPIYSLEKRLSSG
jgi:hypothetical protein